MVEFNGFPKELNSFFKNLKKNNAKVWFDNHRQEYEEFVKTPSMAFVVAMGKELKKISPDIQAIPKVNKSLFRINRDVRFSKDKSPYKTHLALLFWEGGNKRMESPGFYFHVEDNNVLIGTGIYMFSRTQLDTYRQSVIDTKLGPDLHKTIQKIRKNGYQMWGEHYKRVPRGFDPTHKYADYLKYNGLTAMVEMKIPKSFYTKDIIKESLVHFKKMDGVNRWLLKSLMAI
jgi:uncharacterized protein (TIGR02453 family)